jgi:hypothetical protein
MTAIRTGYARCSTDKQDLTAQRQVLLELGVDAERIYLDRGLTGTNRNRPGLDQASTSPTTRCRIGHRAVLRQDRQRDRGVADHPDPRALRRGVRVALDVSGRSSPESGTPFEAAPFEPIAGSESRARAAFQLAVAPYSFTVVALRPAPERKRQV